MDAVQLLMDEQKEEKTKPQGHFSFEWIAKHIIERQKVGKDTIIGVIGERRNGKTNYVLKLLTAYIRLKRAEKEFKWSWEKNFPLTRSKAVELADEVVEESFIDYDEAGDIAYRGDTISLMNKKLIKFLNKSGKKKLLTIFTIPDVYQLDPKILNMCIFLIAVPYRYKDICAFAFIYGRNPNPFVQDKFGLERIKRMFASRKNPLAYQIAGMTGTMKVKFKKEEIKIPYPKQMFRFMKSIPSFQHMHIFKAANKRFEAGYIKNVKDKQLMAHETEEQYIKKMLYDRLYLRYSTVLYNLYMKGVAGAKMSYAQLERLHIDRNGDLLSGRESIQRIVNRMAAKIEAILEDNNASRSD